MINKILVFLTIHIVKFITMCHLIHYIKNEDNGSLVALPKDDEEPLSHLKII